MTDFEEWKQWFDRWNVEYKIYVKPHCYVLHLDDVEGYGFDFVFDRPTETYVK